MLDFPLVLQFKLLVVDRIHPESFEFAMGVEKKVTSGSKLNDSPGEVCDPNEP